ncbi:hypothetical protein Lalb_Chr03g0034481 [Lupinus albus]|uniref:Uncharacterized protein n=1 Tax=Lupinus albus TaxID=3870 RepID=A0A6A4QRG4_LUPAL|nr:hypothetical protein Lalb_Chr03g0034481 [Lupinus albus]
MVETGVESATFLTSFFPAIATNTNLQFYLFSHIIFLDFGGKPVDHKLHI